MRPEGDEFDAAAGRDERLRGLEAQHALDQQVIREQEANTVIDRHIITNLEIALVSARRIGAAIGIVMANEKLTEDQAFDLLRRASQASNRKLRDIADDVLLTGTMA